MEVKTSEFRLLQGGDRSKCRVFLPCRPHKFDFSDLNRFGHKIERVWDISTIFPDEEVSGFVIADVRRMLREHNFDPKSDYLALMGDALVQAIVLLAIGTKYGEVTLLRWDTKMGGYWPCKVQ